MPAHAFAYLSVYVFVCMTCDPMVSTVLSTVCYELEFVLQEAHAKQSLIHMAAPEHLLFKGAQPVYAQKAV